jgi:hypothetical protein
MHLIAGIIGAIAPEQSVFSKMAKQMLRPVLQLVSLLEKTGVTNIKFNKDDRFAQIAL